MATTPTQAQIDQYIEDTYGGKKVKMSQAAVDKVKQQILSQGLTSKWKGQGFGSAEANALDMAKELVASGVTDIHQLGQGTYYEPTAVTSRYVTTNGIAVQPSGGKYYMSVADPNNPDEYIQKEVDPKTVTKQLGVITSQNTGSGAEYDNSTIDVFTPLTEEQQKKVKTDANGNMTVPVATGQGFINKLTGERILSNYNERTTGNAFGGTYAGEGNTAYRVQFDAQGNPYFYTTQHSSNDLANLLQGSPILNAAANIAATYFGGPIGVGLLHAAEGQNPSDILKAAALSWAGGEAGNLVSGSESLIDVLGQTGANIAANAAKSFVTSEGKIDPVAALLTGGMDAGVGAILGDLPGFSSLDKSTQTLVAKAVSNTLRTGKLDPVSLAQAAFKAGTSAMANATNTPTEAEFNKANDDFLQTLAPYLSSSPSAAQSQNEYPPDTKGDWDEVSGKFVPNPEGGTTYGQINPQTSGNVSNMKDWSFDQTSGQWTRTDPVTGEKTAYDYKTPITGTAKTGADIEKSADASQSLSSLTQTKTQTPVKTGTPTGTPTATTPASNPTAIPSWYGLNPADVVKMGGNDVLHINPLEELFGGSIYDHTPASSANKEKSSETDIVKTLEDLQDKQNYASGGDVHALLQLLRS